MQFAKRVDTCNIKKLLQRPQKPRSGTEVLADTIIKQISL